jgi:hypothetical protein
MSKKYEQKCFARRPAFYASWVECIELNVCGRIRGYIYSFWICGKIYRQNVVSRACSKEMYLSAAN